MAGPSSLEDCWKAGTGFNLSIYDGGFVAEQADRQSSVCRAAWTRLMAPEARPHDLTQHIPPVSPLSVPLHAPRGTRHDDRQGPLRCRDTRSPQFHVPCCPWRSPLARHTIQYHISVLREPAGQDTAEIQQALPECEGCGEE